MEELPKTYNPQDVEDKIYKKWEESGLFNPDNLESASDRFWNAEVFSMAMPPPNITAELHVGHSMFLTIQDLMARYARMTGKKTLWLPGTDHAAIATNYVVERQIWETEKKTRHEIGREEFLRRVEQFIDNTRGKIQLQVRKMGASCDWSREKYTFSPELSTAVRTVFKRMYDAGLIYRGNRIVNWCPRCGTTLADDEVEYKESNGSLYFIKYPFAKIGGAVVLATTRPETMLADTAVAVHPADLRYKKFIGQTVMLPLLNREIPIVEDDGADPKFGTGVLKITPGHDAHDFEVGQKNNLPIINLFTPEGKIDQREALDYGFDEFSGLSVQEAREKIVKMLSENGFLEKTENFTHNISVCYRCGTIVEPIVSKQWFVNVNSNIKIQSAEFKKLLNLEDESSLKKIAIAAVKSGAIKIIPKNFEKIYLNWMENLRDWNISRQIWFGHRVPVWYCGEENLDELTEMGFHESVVPQVESGKTKTYRIRDHHFKLNQKFECKNSQTGETFGYGTITGIEKKPVAQIDLKDPEHGATYEKKEELFERLKLHNPGAEINDKTEVFIYSYAFTKEKPKAQGCGEIIVSIQEPTKCESCGNTSLTQDPDTLDTWFSSSLWTFSTLGWPENTPDLKTYHPTTILETGYDILFFWVARMVLMTGFAIEAVPFRTVYLNGLVRDTLGKKMSKSSRNVINPLDVIPKYGTDALRLSMVLGTTPGNDLKMSEEKIENYRNFTNKLWNIARFILSQIENPKAKMDDPQPQTLADEWILAEISKLVSDVKKTLDSYQYGLAGDLLMEFTWNKFADWYLEISKLNTKDSKSQKILPYVLKILLKLWHPFIPFVTEHIWSFFSDEFLMIQEYPALLAPIPSARKNSTLEFQAIQELITSLRNLRAEYRQDPGKILACYLDVTEDDKLIRSQSAVIEKLARVKLNYGSASGDKKMPSPLWRGIRVYLIIPNFDPEKESALAQKELKSVQALKEKLSGQLANSGFLEKAPPEVVEKLKSDVEQLAASEEKLQQKIKSLS
ncbi:valine--tRNA ligase [bacterium]|nr:MAG: valine--tRNA ligase [bacterium]